MFFSSDLSRAVETAEILNTQFQKPFETSPFLREFNYGQYEGTNKDDLWKQFSDLPKQMRDPNNPNRNDLCIPTGETRRQVFTRLTNYLSNICTKYTDDYFMIVSHGGIIYNLSVLYAEKPISIENCDCLACSFDLTNKTFSNFKLIATEVACKTHLNNYSRERE